jgi:hypothetical protein
MNQEVVNFILPSGLVDHFIITRVEEKDDKKEGGTMIEIELEEKNETPSGYDINQYESKGFYPVKIIQDFPLRGKALYLHIKRRRWRHKINKNEEICNDYSQFAKGTKLTQELSDFLKATGRDPRRYD